MKKKILRIAEILGFGVAAVLTVLLLYRVLSWKDTNGEYMSTTKQLYSTKDNLIDVVFMGSSHCYCGIYPSVLWEDAGIAAFDMATSGQDCISATHMLKELLKTQRPKVVMVDLYGFCFDKHGVESNEYRNYLSLKPSVNSVEAVLEYFDGEKKSQRMDYISRFPIVHTRYRELKKYDFVQYEPSIYGRGAMYSWQTTPVEYLKGGDGVTDKSEISANSSEMIDRLVGMSEKYGFSLEFTVIPFDRTPEEQMAINACIDYATDKGIRCTDFTALRDQIDLIGVSDYIDDCHLNALGAGKLTKYIEYTLLSDYELENHKGDSDYEMWDKDLNYFNHSFLESALSSSGNLTRVLSLIRNSEDTVTVFSLEGDYADNSFLFNDLKEMGMSEEDYSLGGKWVYADGVLTKIISNIPGEIATYDINREKTVLLAYTEDFNPGNIVFEGSSYGGTGCYLTVMVYDNVLDREIYCGSFN